MEGRILIFLLRGAILAAAAGFIASPVFADAADEPEIRNDTPDPVYDPEFDRREIKRPNIDNEDFEVGPFFGFMSVEDFGVSPVYGLRLAYHISEDFFVEGAIGRTDTEETSFERLSGGAPLLSDDEREFTYYSVSFGWNVVPGEGFIGQGWSFSSGLYLIGGVGLTEFAGDDRFTANWGFGYRFLARDYLAVHATLRDYMFDIDLLGSEKRAHNIEGAFGITWFF